MMVQIRPSLETGSEDKVGLLISQRCVVIAFIDEGRERPIRQWGLRRHLGVPLEVRRP
jgi:hypothetical protein